MMNNNLNTLNTFLKTADVIVASGLFACAFAALAFSCTKEVETYSGEPEKNAGLKLVIAGTSALSRATGDKLPINEDQINRIAVGVFHADGSLNAIAEPTLNGKVTDAIACVAGTCDIVVVANAPTGTFDGVRNKAEFLNRTIALSETAAAGVQTPGNLPMSGQTTGVVLTASATASPTVSISRLVARISIASIKTAFDPRGEYQKATFVLDKIFLFNALSASRVAPGEAAFTMPATPAWIHGGVVDTNNAWVVNGGERFLLNELPAFPIKEGDAYTVPYWFYAFANNSTTHRTKLVIAGTFDADGDGGAFLPTYAYYPIVVNQAQFGTEITGGDATTAGTGTIARNTEYKLRATIIGKGLPSPGDEAKPSVVQLTVSIAPWELEIVQDVVVN